MNMGFGLRQTQDLRQDLRLEQKQSLRAPGPRSAAHGIKGVKIAHEILLVRGLPGLLIGGVARHAWLAKHRGNLIHRKDVDVVVLSDSSHRLPEKFEGGIDWWLPDGDGRLVNGNGAVLIYRIREKEPIRPGLHIASDQLLWVWRRMESLAFKGERAIQDHLAYPDQTRIKQLLSEYPMCGTVQLETDFIPSDEWKTY